MIYEIYMATCPEGRNYVGCTSKGMKERWRTREFFPAIRFARPPFASLEAAIGHYGKSAFTLTLLATAFTPEDARAIETAMIQQRGSLRPVGYNSAPSSTFSARSCWKRAA